MHAIWLEEIRKNGVTPQFEKYEGSAPALAAVRS